jgi:hypothetical protein
MKDQPGAERAVVVHTADNPVEAMVIRGLLESAGIASPGSVSADPFPLHEVPEGSHGVEIVVLESRADEARDVIADYLAGNKNIDVEKSGEESE